MTRVCPCSSLKGIANWPAAGCHRPASPQPCVLAGPESEITRTRTLLLQGTLVTAAGGYGPATVLACMLHHATHEAERSETYPFRRRYRWLPLCACRLVLLQPTNRQTMRTVQANNSARAHFDESSPLQPHTLVGNLHWQQSVGHQGAWMQRAAFHVFVRCNLTANWRVQSRCRHAEGELSAKNSTRESALRAHGGHLV